jgi:AbrB family looped-hinge helix DNA binding protein
VHSMPVLTVTEKGQVTLRKEVLRHLGIRPGDKIEVNMLPEGRIEARAARRTGHISDIFGVLKRAGGPTLTIEEIGRAAADGWAGKR